MGPRVYENDIEDGIMKTKAVQWNISVTYSILVLSKICDNPYRYMFLTITIFVWNWSQLKAKLHFYSIWWWTAKSLWIIGVSQEIIEAQAA